MPRIALVLVLALAAAPCGSTADDGSGEGSSPTSPSTVPGAFASPSTQPPTTTTTLLAASGECGLHGAYPQPWPQRPSYEVTLDVDPEAGVVTGEMTAAFTPPRDTDRLVFRLWANMPRVGSGGGSLEVTEALLEGEPAETSYGDGGAGPGTPGTLFRVFGDFRAGERVETSLSFRLRLPGAINERVAKAGSGLRLGSILPMLGWIRGEGWHTSPAVSNFSEAVASEVADYDVTVEAPSGFTVLATGEEVEPGRFVASAVRDWAATVAPMELAEGVAQEGRTRVVVGVAEGAGDDPEALLEDTIRSLEDFASRYGPYPYPVLTVGVTASLSGGIEFPQHLQVGAGTSRDHLIHEVAHMWFYALVGNDQWEDPWLDEGLTEYAETRFLGTTAEQAARSIPEFGRGRLGRSHEHWQRDPGAFFRSVYVQGAVALAAVADEVGGLDALDCALRRYVLDHAYGFASPADLVEAVRRQTGVDPTPVLERFGALEP